VIEFEEKRKNFRPIVYNVTEDILGGQTEYIVRSRPAVIHDACLLIRESDQRYGYLDAAFDAGPRILRASAADRSSRATSW
jgi:hypothetical protein